MTTKMLRRGDGRDNVHSCVTGRRTRAALAPAAALRRLPNSEITLGNGMAGAEVGTSAAVAILRFPMARRTHGGRTRVLRTLNLLAFLPLAPRVPVYGRLLMSLVGDRRVPASRKVMLAVAAAYVVTPFDLVPDWLPVIGGLDDVLVVVLAVDAFLAGLPPRLVDEKLAELDIPRSELEADLQRVRRMVPKSVRAAAERIPDAFEGIASFIEESGIEGRLRRLARMEEQPG
jgi:uncharacterized membrane protein YkvA (DUF1232 family)